MKAVSARGYEVRRRNRQTAAEDGTPHSPVWPNATFSPWLADPAFDVTYGLIADSTLVDRYRCHELWQLVAAASKLSRGALLEVGFGVAEPER